MLKKKKNGGVEGRALIFSCENTKIATRCSIDRRMLIPQKKKNIFHILGQRRSPSKMIGVKSCLESNLRPTRDAQRAQTNLCVHQDPGKGTVTPTRD